MNILLKLSLCFLMQSALSAADFDEIRPMQVVANLNSNPSMINSVDFHPSLNLFCATFTHNDQVVLYRLNLDSAVQDAKAMQGFESESLLMGAGHSQKVKTAPIKSDYGSKNYVDLASSTAESRLNEANDWQACQVLQNPLSELSCPQHALFSRDGKSLVVANWGSQTFNVYRMNPNGRCKALPIASIPYSFDLDDDRYRPHGMAFSGEGDYLAVAFGASTFEPRAVALYQFGEGVNFKLLSVLHGGEIEEGIPKGIVFSPDGSCLIVTLAATNALAIYSIDWKSRSIDSPPRQVLRGKATRLCRPEDVKFTVDGNFCAVSNSMEDTVTFYAFDRQNNLFFSDTPSYTLENPEAKLQFPHGLAFSSDGKYFAVSQFGNVAFDEHGHLTSWAKERRESIAVYHTVYE